MEILLYLFIAHVMSYQERTDGDEALQGSEFRKSRMGKGGMNFCLGRGCLVKDISLRFAVLLGEWVQKGSFGNGPTSLSAD